LKAVAILREDLVIDLRPLASLEPACVEATYHLENTGPGKRFDLVFVAGSEEISDFEVRLGGTQLLESQRVGRDETRRRWEEMPASWKPPRDSFPGIDFSPAHVPIRDPDWQSEVALLAFSVELPAGKSTLRARYRTRAAGAYEGYPTTTWYLLYVLGPARAWGRFGGLEVTAHLPAGWQHVSTPELGREGDTLRASFPDLPADTLVVGTRMPHRARPIHSAALMALPVLALLAVFVFGWIWGACLGSALARRRCGRMVEMGSIGLSVVVLGALGVVLVFLTGVMAVKNLAGLPGDQVSPYYGGQFFHHLCGFGVLALLASPLSIWAVRAGALSRLQPRRLGPAEPPSSPEVPGR
jgi:hypothetical protein